MLRMQPTGKLVRPSQIRPVPRGTIHRIEAVVVWLAARIDHKRHTAEWGAFAGLWDIRVPVALRRWELARRRLGGYWFKVNRVEARKVVAWLATAYGIPAPVVRDEAPKLRRGTRGAGRVRGCFYVKADVGYIEVHGRCHLKTVFHEFYHGVEYATDGAYCSDDQMGGPTSLAWRFADRMMEVITTGEMAPPKEMGEITEKNGTLVCRFPVSGGTTRRRKGKVK